MRYHAQGAISPQMERGMASRWCGRDAVSAWELLSADEALLAFPVVLAVDGPTLDLAAWRRLVRAWLQQGRRACATQGIAALRTPPGTIFSVFLFAVRDRGMAGTSLCVPRVWLVEIGAPGRAFHATLGAVEQLAQRHGCAAFAIELALTDGPARDIARALLRVEQTRDEAPDDARAAPLSRGQLLPFQALPRR
jgi:hypothetical protein